MDAKFHHDTAMIYDFAQARRAASIPATSERVEPRLFSAEIVPMRDQDRRTAAPIVAREPALSYVDFGSGWYHDVAIEKTDPSRH